MSIVTKKARKSLSIATVIGLAAGLLTGVVAAPASAIGTDSIAVTPSVGLRAGKTYATSVVLAKVTLSTLNGDTFFGASNNSLSAWCTAHPSGCANGQKKLGSSGTAPSSDLTDVILLEPRPTDATEVSADFKIASVDDTTDPTKVTANIVFSAATDSFSKAGEYKFTVVSYAGVSKNFSIFVGGVPTTATLAAKFTLLPKSGAGQVFTSTLADAAGNATTLTGAETLKLIVSGAVLSGGTSFDAVDALTGKYTWTTNAPVAATATSTTYQAGWSDGTDQALSNAVTVVTKELAVGTTQAVAVKNAVVSTASTATIITTTKSVTYKFSGSLADAVVKFTLGAFTGGTTPLTADNTTAANDGIWVVTDADGDASFTVVTTATPVANNSYSVYTSINVAGTTSETDVATYQPAGTSPAVSVKTPNSPRSVSIGSTTVITYLVSDVFGLPVSGKWVRIGGLGTGLSAGLVIEQNTDANGLASFNVVDVAKTVRTETVTVTSAAAVSGDDVVLKYITDATPASIVVEVNDAAGATATATAVCASAYCTSTEIAAFDIAIDSAGTVMTDMLKYSVTVKNAAGIVLEGIDVTATASSGTYLITTGDYGTAFTANGAVTGDDAAATLDLVSAATPVDNVWSFATKTGASTVTFAVGSASKAISAKYHNVVTDLADVKAAAATVSATTGAIQTVNFTAVDKFGNSVAGATVGVSTAGVGRVFNGYSGGMLMSDANGVVRADVTADKGQVGAQTITALINKGNVGTGAAKTASSVVTWADAVPVIKIGTLKGKIVVKVWNSADKAVAVMIGGKLRTSFIAGSNYVVKTFAVAKGKKSVVVKVYASPTVSAKKTVTVK